MDTLTHAISGAVIGAATALPGRGAGERAGTIRQRALWGGLFAAFPDSDMVLALFLEHFDYLFAHRGVTHSLVVLPIWAALLGGVAAKFGKLRYRDMVLLAALALTAHICGDLITSYGTRLFAPFWNAPLAFPITFIIDPIFTTILLTGLVIALLRWQPMAARVSGIVLLAYLGVQTVAYLQAEKIGREYVQEQSLDNSLVMVFPQPFSPFNWKVVVVHGESFHRSYINLLKSDTATPDADAFIVQRMRAAYRPVEDAYWQVYPRRPEGPSATRELAVAAWEQPEFAGFRRFALLPYVTEISGDSLSVCVWFTDLRFTLPELSHPFEYAMCRVDDDWSLRFDREEN